MGMMTDAHCFACGYDASLTLGGGMRNFRTYAAWPVACAGCEAITTANFKQSPLRCEACGSDEVTPMSDPEEWQGDGEITDTWALGGGWWGESRLMLTDGHYRCPKCGKYDLRFGTNAAGRGRILFD